MKKRIGIVGHSGAHMLAMMQALTSGAGFSRAPRLPTVKRRAKSDRELRSPECVAELKDKADFKRTRKNAKRVRDLLCGGWVASGYHAPFSRTIIR